MPARRQFDREHVASIVLEAMDIGLPIVQTLQEILGANENQARHMIRTVRNEGLLGTGAHKPVRAMIHRGSGNEKSWIVCQECTCFWPCQSAFPHGTFDTMRSDDDEPARS